MASARGARETAASGTGRPVGSVHVAVTAAPDCAEGQVDEDGYPDALSEDSKEQRMGMTKVPTKLALGMDNVSYLRGLAAWQLQLFRPSPDSHLISEVLKEGVEKCAEREEEIHFFFTKGHAGMEVNTSSDRCTYWAAKLGEDREWHETDHTGLLYENVDEEE
eukprot:1987992-Rhodomonas_salina.2